VRVCCPTDTVPLLRILSCSVLRSSPKVDALPSSFVRSARVRCADEMPASGLKRFVAHNDRERRLFRAGNLLTLF
jgi:hypothetical protein